MRPSKRKLFVPFVLTAVLSLILAACGDSEDDSSDETSNDTSGEVSGELTFVNYGGLGMEAAKEGWLEPFTDKTGVTFQTDQPVDPAKVKAMVEAGRTTWDVIDIDPTTGSACGTLYEKRPADYDLSEIQTDYLTDDCMIPIIGQAVGLVYNTELFGDNPPTSITDFMDTDTFPGKRIIFNWYAGSAEPLLMAAGVPAADVVPFDWDKLEGVVDTLGSDLAFQDTLDLQTQAQSSGDFAMCLCYLGRAALAAQEGANIDVVWDKIWVGIDGLYVVEGTENPDAAWAFHQYLATSEGQNGFSAVLPYAPMTTGEPPEVPEEFEAWMPSFNEDKIEETAIFDVNWQSENSAELADKWTALTAG